MLVEIQRGRVRGLVQTDFAPAGQVDGRLEAPALPFDGRTADALSLEGLYERLQIVAHQVEN